MLKQEETWDEIILPKNKLFDLKLKEIWQYKDLLILLVRRDFVATYKQTVLGGLWFFLQPLLTTFLFAVIFGSIAKISTDGLPKILFYLSGITIWNYFATCLTNTGNTFRGQVHLFSKVYFPRLIIPLSIVISNLIKFGIQFLLLLVILIYYLIKGAEIKFGLGLLLLPYLIFLVAMLSMGIGLVVASITAKYRDLSHLVASGVRFLMYFSPVVLPLSFLPEKYLLLMLANPMTPIIEMYRYALFGAGTFTMSYLVYATCFTAISLVIGLVAFNQTQKSFIDTV